MRIPCLAVGSLLFVALCSCVMVPPSTTAQSRRPAISDADPLPTGGEADSAPKILRFRANPPSVLPGGTVRLEWSTRNAVSAVITGVGKVPAAGRREVATNVATTFTLTATGADGTTVTASVQISVPAPTQPPASAEVRIESFEANPPTVLAGNSAQLTWRTRNAVTVTISEVGSVATSGTHSVQPAKRTTYRLTATDQSGRSETAEVSVGVAHPIKIPSTRTPAPLRVRPLHPGVLRVLPRPTP